jgi:dihydroorotase
MTNSLIIQKATIVLEGNQWNGKTADIYIENGLIKQIASDITVANVPCFDASGCFLSLGWFDVYSFCPDPGEDWKETLDSHSQAASHGGFTEIAAFCGIDPLPEKASSIESILQRQERLSVKIHPIGVASEGRNGKEMAEVYELSVAGCLAQSDGIVKSPSSSLKAKLMEYCASMNIPYLQFPFDADLVKGAEVHEGFVSVNLGLKGIPDVSESIQFTEMIELAKWLNVPLRILGISSEKAVNIIRNAKKEGVQIHTAVAAMNLAYTDQNLEEFDENFKVLPPLRAESDRKALVHAVLDGTIQAIFSNHTPEDIEHKNLEFAYANFGAATFDSFFAIVAQAIQEQDLPKLVHVLTKQNRDFYGVECPVFAEGEVANFTIFSNNKWEMIGDFVKSKSHNVLNRNKELTGRIHATYTKNKLTHFNHE